MSWVGGWWGSAGARHQTVLRCALPHGSKKYYRAIECKKPLLPTTYSQTNSCSVLRLNRRPLALSHSFWETPEPSKKIQCADMPQNSTMKARKGSIRYSGAGLRCQLEAAHISEIIGSSTTTTNSKKRRPTPAQPPPHAATVSAMSAAFAAGVSAANFGIKAVAALVCLGLYLYTLVAPYVLRDTRDFGITFDD